MKNTSMRDAALVDELLKLTDAHKKMQRRLKCCKDATRRGALQAEYNQCTVDLAWSLLMNCRYEQSYNLYKSLPWEGYAKEKCLGIGIAFTEVGNLEEAKIVIDGGLEDFPDSETLWVAKGNLHKKQGQWTDALQRYERALEIDAGNPLVRLSKATALYGLHQYAEAIPLLEALTEKYPNEPHSFSLLAYCHLNTGRPEAAAVIFQSLIRQGCFEADIYNGLFCSYVEMEDIESVFETAMEAAEKAVDADETTFCNLAYAFLLKDCAQESRAVVSKGLRLYPDHEGLREMLEMLDKEADEYYDKAPDRTETTINHAHTGGVKWN